ncbi:ubiquitin-like domain-containing protein [Nocardia sp. NPDC003693]
MPIFESAHRMNSLRLAAAAGAAALTLISAGGLSAAAAPHLTPANPVDSHLHQVAAQISLTVKTLTGKTTAITIAADATVADLKKAVRDKDGTAVEQQLLVFNGKELADPAAKLSTLGITDGATVHLVLRT